MYEITYNKDLEITKRSLNNIRQEGKYFLTLSLSHKGNIYKLPNEPLISLSRKKIIKSTLVGKKIVKEFIGYEDYKITIRGVCVGKNRYPKEQLETLIKLNDINDVLDIVNNKFFTMFEIYGIVITSINFGDMEGKPYLQDYTIKAVSNETYYADSKRQKHTPFNL